MFADAIAAAAINTPSVRPVAATVPGLVLHIDGDYLAYYASGNNDTTQGEARQKALDLIERFKSYVGATSVVMHNTAKGCQKGERYLIATVKPYQAQRVGDEKPKNHAYLQNWLQTYEGSSFVAKNWSTREADDGIGACAHYGLDRGCGYVAIATADKDLRMLPGLHIEWVSGALVRVEPGTWDVRGPTSPGIAKGLPIIKPGREYGLRFFYKQMLMGDSTDNIPGLPLYQVKNPDGTHKAFKKLGEKTADDFLADAKDTQDAHRIVLNLYRGGYYGMPEGYAEDRFCEQAALLWMRLDNKASVGDFARHMGHSRINHLFDPPLWAAVDRLEHRVRLARSEINALSDCDSAYSPNGAAA